MYARGHEKGTRQVKGSTPEFDRIQEAHLRTIEAELAAKQAQQAGTK